MGSFSSKAATNVGKKTAREVLATRPPPIPTNIPSPPSSNEIMPNVTTNSARPVKPNIYDSENKIDPEILKEISKWSVATIENRKKDNSFLVTAPAKKGESAALTRLEEDSKIDELLKEKKKMKGRVTEDRLLELFALIRQHPNDWQNKIDWEEETVDQETLKILSKYVYYPRVMPFPEDDRLRMAF